MGITLRITTLLILVVNWQAAMAWDSVGHRLTAAVAVEYLSADTTSQLLEILSQHPRYQEDFLESIPGFVDTSDSEQLARWMLGQAAYWPDIARGLAPSERQKYNRPDWHYTDGAWIRGSADSQGNVYIGIEKFADVQGLPASTVRSERQASNVATALDYNAFVLSNPVSEAGARAIALCWVLHLVGDIHQPLHTGSLFTGNLFRSGDRGGNGIDIGRSNLHSRWDQALRDEGVEAALPAVLQSIRGINRSDMQASASNWPQWMNESRQLLQTVVYSSDIITEIKSAEASGRDMNSLELSADYVAEMKRLSMLRLGLAGLRLATWFEDELNQ